MAEPFEVHDDDDKQDTPVDTGHIKGYLLAVSLHIYTWLLVATRYAFKNGFNLALC